jgi:hypothetical protein
MLEKEQTLKQEGHTMCVCKSKFTPSQGVYQRFNFSSRENFLP